MISFVTERVLCAASRSRLEILPGTWCTSASVGTALRLPIPMESRGRCRGDVYLMREMRWLWSANSARSVLQPPTGGTGAPRREAPCAHALSFTPPIHPYPPWPSSCSCFSWRPRDPARWWLCKAPRIPTPSRPSPALEASDVYCHVAPFYVNEK